jgi:cytochrome b561
MSLRSNDQQWGTLAKTFHWLMALAILGNGLFGLLMDLARSPMQKINWLALHKSIGLTVLGLFALRLLWRALDRRPPDETAPRWQQLTAHLVHGVLYLMMAAIPLSGWWFNSLAGKPLQWFKLFSVPALAGKSDALAHVARDLHEYLFWLLLLLLVVHVGAALKHHLVHRNNVLRRMLPFGRPRQDSSSSTGASR